MEKKYSDYKIGDKVRCVKNIIKNIDYSERIVVGKTYVVNDVDYHFPDKIAVKLKGPYYFHTEFVPIVFFIEDINDIRDRKINSIIK